MAGNKRMASNGPAPAAGWLKYAGHQWSVDRVELCEGVLRISISGMATRNVPAGITPGEIYGRDGALVCRIPAMEHGDLCAGEFGGLIMNFFLPRFANDTDADDISEPQLGLALQKFMVEQTQKPITETEMLQTARTRWVNARRAAWTLLSLAMGDTAIMLGAPLWTCIACSVGGAVTGIMYERFDREWWTK